jgi:thiol-disulfide isomerase/thioredoxin
MKKIIFALMFVFCAIMSRDVSAQESVSLLLPINEQSLDSVLRANEGNVVLINLWAYWCQPCKEEFPELVKLYNNYKDKNFKLIFISLDFDEALATKTEPYLKSQNVDWITYYNKFKKDEDMINFFSKDWDGAIPATFIYDKSGNKVKELVGKKTYEVFEQEVLKYLDN